jgi:hypothetical protein
MIFVAGAELLPGQLGHVVYQLSVEKALFFGLSLVGLRYQRRHGLGIHDSIVHRIGAGTAKA